MIELKSDTFRKLRITLSILKKEVSRFWTDKKIKISTLINRVVTPIGLLNCQYQAYGKDCSNFFLSLDWA